MLFKAKIMDNHGNEVDKNTLLKKEIDQVNKIYSKWDRILRTDKTLSLYDITKLNKSVNEKDERVPPVGTKISPCNTGAEGLHGAEIVLPEPFEQSLFIKVKHPLSHSFVFSYQDYDNIMVVEEEPDTSFQQRAYLAKVYCDSIKPEDNQLVAIRDFFGAEKDALLSRICEQVGSDGRFCLSTPSVVSNLLGVYCANETYQLIDFTLLCLNTLQKKDTSTEEYQHKLNNLSILLKNLVQALTRPLSYFEQQVLIKLVEQMPEYTEWNTVGNLARLFTKPEFDLSCLVLAHLDYLERQKFLPPADKNSIKELIKLCVCPNATNKEDNVWTQIPKNPFLDKLLQVQSDYLPYKYQQSETEDDAKRDPHDVLDNPEFLHKMILFYSDCWENLMELREAYKNEPNRQELLSAIEYMEKAQNGNHRGINAMKTFVETLLSDELRNANSKQIQSAKRRLLPQKPSQYSHDSSWFSGLYNITASLQEQVFNSSTGKKY